MKICFKNEKKSYGTWLHFWFYIWLIKIEIDLGLIEYGFNWYLFSDILNHVRITLESKEQKEYDYSEENQGE